MATTTNLHFNDKTEALEVAQVFSEQVRGKTVLVTGVNPGGIGFTTAQAFASQGAAHVIVAGRTVSKLEESIKLLRGEYPNVDYRTLKLDLSRQVAVRAAAEEVLRWNDLPEIDILVNSAGVMLLPERTLSEDGIEMHFATNHIGHYLFTCLIMPKLLKAASHSRKGATRVVNVSSLSPTWAGMRWSDINFDKVNNTLPESEQPTYGVQRAWGMVDPENASYLPLEGYNQSKVANVLFSIAINKRLYQRHGILSVALHPGIMQTELGRHAPPGIKEAVSKMKVTYKSLGAGASTSMVAALDPKMEAGKAEKGKQNYGTFLADCQLNDQADPRAESSEEAEKLWKLSEQLVGQKFEW